MTEQNPVRHRDRYLSPLDVWGMAFGCMVGWGAFVMPGSTFLPVAGPAGTIISMVIGFLIMLVIGTCISYLMSRSSISGGIYSYTKEALGRDHAFLCAWFLCLSYLTIVFLNGTALFLVIHALFGEAAYKGFHYTIAGNKVYLCEFLLSMGALTGIGLLFLVAGNVLRRIATILAVILAAGIVVTTVACLPHADLHDIFGTFGYQDVNPGFAIFSLVILAPWAFVGFEVTAFDTEHFRFPARKTKRILFGAIAVAAFAYTAMALVSVSVLPDGYASWSAYIADLKNLDGIDSVPTFYAARHTMGTSGLVIIGITAMAAILTGIIGAYRASVHLLSSMAEDRILSEKFAKTTYCIFFIMFLSVIISLLGRNTLSWFIDLTSFGAIVAYGYTSVAAYRTARTEANYRVMAAGLAGTVISVLFGIVQLVPHLVAMEPMCCEAYLLLALWCLIGFIFYWHTVKRSSLSEYNGMSTSGLALFTLLLYAALMWLGKLLMRQTSLAAMHRTLLAGGIVMVLIVFIGLAVMLYIQNLVRKMHEKAERDKIRLSEGSLAKSQFLFNMTHDIRTPMNAIIGYVTLAGKEPDSMLRSYLAKIEKSSWQLRTILDDILEMNRHENGKFELEYNPTDLCMCCEEIRELFAKRMKQKKIRFSVFSSRIRNRYVWCDRKNFIRVLLNLIANSFRFTPEDGSVTLSIYEKGDGKNGYGVYELRVKDSGIGMPKGFATEVLNAVDADPAEPEPAEDKAAEDSGMDETARDLVLTRNVIERMGGAIEFFTSPGNGTEAVIHLRFRLAAEKDMKKELANEKKAAGEAIDFTGKRLLVADGNAVSLDIARLLLERMGFFVETAENGKTAVEMIASAKPGHYDALLMDIQLPDMDGYAVAGEIRAMKDPKRSAIPILVVTAEESPEDIGKEEAAGIRAHITKPVDMAALKKELGAMLKA